MMVGLGLRHYGRTLGLYEQPRDEIVRVLAYEIEQNERREAARAKVRR